MSATALRALLSLPPTLSRSEAKQARVCLVLTLAGAFFHALNFGYFGFRDLWALAAVNVASVLTYLVAAALLRRGRVLLAILLIGVELLLYVNGMAVVLSFEAGFSWYLLTATVAAYMIFRVDQRWLRRLWIGTFLGVGALATFASLYNYAPDAVSDELLREVYVLNLVTNVAVLWLAASYFAYASDRSEAEAEAERERSERLLLNILPAPIAERLKTEPGVIADAFPSVSVLFSDIVGFTRLSSEISTEELITILNEIFSTFDRLAKEHGVEKIKTIGDAYMVVGGLPRPAEDHAARTVRMALDMRDAMARWSEDREHPIDVRIGVHTGPVVAGVIGEEKFAYDLWGDTVNVASRMESHGEKGRVQISEATRDAVGEAFALEERGTIEIKGRGRMRTFFVERERAAEEVSTPDAPSLPRGAGRVSA